MAIQYIGVMESGVKPVISNKVEIIIRQKKMMISSFPVICLLVMLSAIYLK
jgi:hypothetical protein